jgi:transcriptional regulator with GAF, ATPase, and Fis domain
VIGLNMKASKLGRQLLPATGTAPATASGPAASDPPTLPGGVERLQTAEEAAHESEPAGGGATFDAPPAIDSQSVLAAGIQDISQALVEVDSLADLLRIIIETMYRAMGFKRVLLCMRDGRTGQMSARFGFGAGADEAATYFRFTLGGRNDIFNIILSNDKDVLISDATDPKLARFIPEWFKTRFPVQTFIVFPLRIKGSPVAMIYADKDHAGTIVIADKELSLLRTLCNQAILAIKQSAGGR